MICRNHADVEEGVQQCSRCGLPYCGDCVVMLHGLPYCASCKNEKLLDVQSGTDRGTMQYATAGKRFVALIIDQFIVMIPVLVVGMVGFGVLMAAKQETMGMLVLGLTFIGVWFGYITYEALMLGSRGQTLGKRVMHVRVVRPDGSAISYGQAWGRSLLRAVMVHVLVFVNYIPGLVTQERTCVHDLVAGTRVVAVD
jgi:uncharacterized RDD family membrane protein YckC